MVRLIKILAVGMGLIVSGCAGNIGQMQGKMEMRDSTISQLEIQVKSLSERLGSLEADLGTASSKVNSLEADLNANNKESYLRVLVPILNIRTTPTTANNNIIAKAEKGAFLRKIANADKDGNWLKVEFLVDNYPYLGYVADNPEFLKEELYDPMTFNRIYNRKLVTYQWETEAAMEMRRGSFKTLGVFVNAEEDFKPERFLGHLSNSLRDHNIYIKPLTGFNMNDVTALCNRNGIEGIMAVQIDNSDQASPMLDIKLFDKRNVILYSTSVPFQAVRIGESYGAGTR